MTKIFLNKKEQLVLRAIQENAEDCSGGDFAMVDEIQAYLDVYASEGIKISPKELSGYVSCLKKGGLIETDGFQIVIKKEVINNEQTN